MTQKNTPPAFPTHPTAQDAYTTKAHLSLAVTQRKRESHRIPALELVGQLGHAGVRGRATYGLQGCYVKLIVYLKTLCAADSSDAAA
jgi:hypothetical protein